MIIYCTRDLIFATRIRSTAESIGAKSRPARDRTMLQARLDRVDDGRGKDPVRAVMIDLDLGDEALNLLSQVKRHSPDVVVVVFGSHVAVDWLDRAREAGADHVMPRSQFVRDLTAMLERWGQPADPDAQD